MRIGLLTDTHLPALLRHPGELGPEVEAFFSTVDLILHAGDVTSPIVLDWLEQFAPVLGAVGNNDPIWDPRMELAQILDINGWRIGLVHDLMKGEDRPVAQLHEQFGTRVDVMVWGHTHYERLDYRENTVLINSGSAVFPHHKEARLGTVGLLEVTPGKLRAEIVLLGETAGHPNPGKAMSLQVEDGRLVDSQGIVLNSPYHNGATP